ncbi:MAG: hypothetical protein ACTSU4_09325 [Promethearchaeota archaeon]
MILQIGDFIGDWLGTLIGGLFIALILAVAIIAVIAFIIGVALTRWLAKRKDWSDSWGKAIIVNIIWIIISISMFFLINYVQFDPTILYVIALIVSLLVGAIVVAKIYDQGFLSSLGFVLIILILLFIIMLIVSIVILFLVVMIFIVLIFS